MIETIHKMSQLKLFFVEQISQEVLSKESEFELLFCDRNDCKSNFAVCAYIV